MRDCNGLQGKDLRNMGLNIAKVLFLIVGTGDKKHPDYPENYLRLLRKAIDETDAENIILLPSFSEESISHAEDIKKEFLNKRNVEIECLPENATFNCDKCYAFYEKVFQKQFDKKFLPQNMSIDFTHGVKAMSVALYAVALHYRISDFHYIEKIKDENGNFAGETVQNFDACFARCLSVLEQCKTLFAAWQFPAAKSLLKQESIPESLKADAKCIEALSDFYSAWDRLDYVRAASELFKIKRDKNTLDFQRFNKFNPCKNENIEAFISQLASSVDSDCAKDAEIAGNMIFDLYANALRCIDSGKYEDAAIRAYRIAEMLGQYYLFHCGYCSGNMNSKDIKVSEFMKTNKIEKRSNCPVCFSRTNVIAFLRHIDHHGYRFLKEIESDIERRNNSVLIHGFSPSTYDDQIQTLKAVLDKMVRRLKQPIIFNDKRIVIDEDVWQSKLNVAMFMNSFKDNNR